MRKLKLLALLLSLPLLSGCNTQVSMGYYSDAEKYLVGNQTYEGEITSIDIDWIKGLVQLKPSVDINGVKIEEENNLEDNSKVHTYFDNGKLSMKFMASGHRAFIDEKDKHVLLTYNPSKIASIDIGMTSGKLLGSSIHASEDIEISLTSGRAEIESLRSPKAEINITSGYVEVGEFIGNELEAKMTTGTIITKNIHAKTYKGRATSGTLEASFVQLESGSINATSATIKMTMPEEGGKVTLNKTSGSVTANRECTVDGKTYTFGNGSAMIDIDISSGKVIIN